MSVEFSQLFNVFQPEYQKFDTDNQAYLYRVDWWGDTLVTQRFHIVKHTPKGVWITVDMKKKFVNLTARKQYASETQEQALVGFIKRKECQIKILTTQLTTVKEGLIFAQKQQLEKVNET